MLYQYIKRSHSWSFVFQVSDRPDHAVDNANSHFGREALWLVLVGVGRRDQLVDNIT